MLFNQLAQWIARSNYQLPPRISWRLGGYLAKREHKKARRAFGPEIPDLLPPSGLPHGNYLYDSEFILDYPWLDHMRLRPTIVSAPEVLVFMPTYSPDAAVEPGFRDSGYIEHYPNIMQRGWRKNFDVPWTYLDAIDSVIHTLSANVHLVVADYRSSEEVRQVLLDHQRALNAPNYELWFSEKTESIWKAMNSVVLNKFKDGGYSYFIQTTSDLLWTQRSWLTECVTEMNRDFDCLITCPTVSKVATNVPYQGADLPVDKDPFTASLANAYCRVFHRDFFEAYGYRYPDIFRGCYTESFVPMMLDALGKTQKMVPRANCAHCEGLDIWEAEDGTTYAAGIEHQSYLDIMGQCKEMLATFPTPKEKIDFYRKVLYRDMSYYDGLVVRRYVGGEDVGA